MVNWRNIEENIDGQAISGIRTMGSMYDQGHLLIVRMDTGEECRISTSEIMKLLDEFKFRAVKHRVYRHLEVTHLWNEETREYEEI